MSILIEKAGVLDTIQDEGRTGMGHLGVNPNGAMDWYSHQLANALAGNNIHAAVIEIHFPAPIIRFHHSCIIGLAGADFGATINNQALQVNRTVMVPAGARLQFVRKFNGERVYIAIKGGLKISPVLGSQSTNLKACFGGIMGRRLMAGDEIAFVGNNVAVGNQVRTLPWYARTIAKSSAIRVMAGPEWDWLSQDSQRKMLNLSYRLQPQSDRMAIRWEADPVRLKEERQMVSSAVSMGTIQLLPNGQLLTLMADHQTVGGYPRILQVAKADLPLLAQMHPGNSIPFKLVSGEDAYEASMQLRNDLKRLSYAIRFNLQTS